MWQKIKLWAEKVKNFFNEKVEDIGDFIIRNIIWIAIGTVALFILTFNPSVIFTISYIVLIEALALFLSNVAVYIFTSIKFIKELKNGSSDIIKLGLYIVLGFIILAVHFVVGQAAYGIFLADKG